MNNEQLFDSIIKDKLQSIFIDQPENAWTKFSNASKMKTAREGHFFDQAINKSIINVKTTVTGNEWLAFKNHWDQYAHNLENEFDDQIRASLRKEKITMDARAFEILESAISSSDIKNRNLVPSKIIEAILMAVILLLLFMYAPLLQQNNFDTKPPATNEIQNAEQQRYDRADNIEPVQDVVQVNSNVTPPLVTSSFGGIKGQTVVSGQVPGVDQFISLSTEKGSAAGVINNEESGNNYNILNADIKNEKVNNVHQIGSVLIQDSETFISDSYKARSFDIQEFNKLSLYDITPSSLFSNDMYPNYEAIPFKLAINKKLLSTVWLGIKLGRAFDVIRTPVTSPDGKLVSSQKVKSSIFGFNLEIKNDFVNIETGVQYSNKKFGVGDNNAENTHFITIPLSLKKEFFPDNKVVPYIKLGPDVTVVASAVYKPNADVSTLNSRGNQLAPYSGYTDQEIEDGIFKSGKLSSNSFLGLHGSLGFEVKINNLSKFNLEVNQQINPFEKGLGINNHRFSETSVSIGYKRLLFENLY